MSEENTPVPEPIDDEEVDSESIPDPLADLVEEEPEDEED